MSLVYHQLQICQLSFFNNIVLQILLMFFYDIRGKRSKICSCLHDCMIYIYPEKNLRAYPGVERGSQEWEDTYKIRVNVEKSINHFKDSFCIANRKTQNEKTLHADLLLAGITQLVTVLVADKIHQHQYIRSLKPLIA